MTCSCDKLQSLQQLLRHVSSQVHEPNEDNDFYQAWNFEPAAPAAVFISHVTVLQHLVGTVISLHEHQLFACQG